MILSSSSRFKNLTYCSIDLLDEIGEYLGFTMWNKRDLSKKYAYRGFKDDEEAIDDYIEADVIFYKDFPLLIYQYNAYRKTSDHTLYIFNLKTFKPTKNSPIKKELSPDLLDKLKLALNTKPY